MCRHRNRADIRVTLARSMGHMQNLLTDGHLRPCADVVPNNGLTSFRVFSYEVQNNGNPVRNATADDILFRAAPIGTVRKIGNRMIPGFSGPRKFLLTMVDTDRYRGSLSE